MIRSIRLRAVAFAFAATAVISAGLSGSQPAAAKNQSAGNRAYIVQLADSPVVAYDGTVPGLRATRPAKGSKINPNSPDVVRYAAYLDNRHDATLAAVGGGRKLYSYRYTFNGFAAELTEAQVAALRQSPSVIAISKDELRPLDTISTPAFLGLTQTGGAWDQLGGVGKAGEGKIVGIVDTGAWPESLSFSDRLGSNGNQSQDGKLNYQQIPGWHGKCKPGEAFPASKCNQKLIGAQWFNQGFGGDAGVKADFPYEYASARDADGHGTHTASTAAGNNSVQATVEGVVLGSASGIAPRARIAAYKACWGRGNDGGCFNSDSVAAIDQAVADGVDVINFSISGSLTSFLDPVEVAFLFAADAGVFVAASAGNSGPGASTVAHNSPWLTTVAAGTHDRQFQASVKLGNGASYLGAGLGAAVPATPVILSPNAGLAGADANAVRLCYAAVDNGGTPVLDPAKVAGKIVVCDRGVIDRVHKSLAVKEAGGVGMVLANTSANSLNADFHSVPTVHVDHVAGAAIKTYVSGSASPTAELTQGVLVPGSLAPDVAAFSSRGPALAGNGNLLKPDIMAPGVDILAAVSPAGHGGKDFDFLSGTSMSSPHVAGIGALMKQAHPDWSPAMIKSALVTTASTTRNNGTPIPLNPFGYGAGQVVPTSALDPGLVYDAGFLNWLGFLCGTGQLTASYCPGITINPSNLNYPSIAIGALAGIQTVTRTVKSVGSKPETYTATVDGMTGTTVEITPNAFTINPGATQAFNVKITRTTAPLNAYSTGSVGTLVWTGDQGHVVKSPIVVKPVALAAPVQVTSNGAAISYGVTFGYTGTFSATARGLIAPVLTDGTVADDPANEFSPTGAGVVAIPVTIPPGTTYARFELFDADVLAGSDIDLYVYKGGTLVGASGGGTSAEQVNLVNPAAGTDYVVYVHGWQTAGGAVSPFRLHTWLLGTADAGNMTVSAPSSATLGAPGTINLGFIGLAPATKYLGSVAYSGSTGMPNPTIVRVNTP